MKTINRFLMTMALLITAVTGAWGAGYTVTLTLNYSYTDPNTSVVYEGIKLYDLTKNDDGIMPTDGSFRFRPWTAEKGYWGMYNFDNGNRTATIKIPVKAGNKLIFQFTDTQGKGTTINSVTSCSTITKLDDGYLACDVLSDASDITISIGKYSVITSILVMQPYTPYATVTYNINNMLTFSGETYRAPQAQTIIGSGDFTLGSLTLNKTDVKASVVENIYNLDATNLVAIDMASTFTQTTVTYTESDLVKPTYTFVADEKGYAITDDNITVSPALDENNKISLLSDMPVTVTPQTGYKLQSLTVGSLEVTGPDETTGALSFTSGTEDLDATCYLVRDLSVQTSVQVVNGEGTEQSRFVLTKSGESYDYADQPNYVLTDLKTKEALDQTDLECTLQKKNGETWEDYTAATPVPGEYRMKITPKADGRYTNTGDVIVTDAFTLYFAQTVEVRADGFATFISDEALQLAAEETDAELYTVGSVSADKVVLQALTQVPANTPFIIYNPTTRAKTVPLVSVDGEVAAVTYYEGFKGTTAGESVSISDNYDYYVCTGKEFAWVETAGAVPANKCWLEVPKTTEPATARQIVFNGKQLTGISAVETAEGAETSVWYNLDGTRIEGKPSRKGIYLNNGKKYVIK